ncbi:dioxygenase family protein [Nonomuraea maritima]|uniref:dioxygenase family protein n=1 Tax=Nonomuraea maritima TaxID=683260 RepID=UPI00370FB9E8
MGHDDQCVSRRGLITGMSSIGLGGLLAGCASAEGTTTAPTTTPVPTPTGSPTATVAPVADLDALFAEARTCKLTAAATQGPFYFEAGRVRSDIREGKPGVPLRVAIKVQDAATCRPLRDAVVEIWHCDAAGLYSGAEAASAASALSAAFAPDENGRFTDMKPLDRTRYLRGTQVTNADGVVEFATVWPGWYHGRTVHIHAMVHAAGRRVLTTQLMFDEELSKRVLAMPPYAAHGLPDTGNAADEDFDESMLMNVVPDGDGYVGAIILSADPA